MSVDHLVLGSASIATTTIQLELGHRRALIAVATIHKMAEPKAFLASHVDEVPTMLVVVLGLGESSTIAARARVLDTLGRNLPTICAGHRDTSRVKLAPQARHVRCSSSDPLGSSSHVPLYLREAHAVGGTQKHAGKHSGRTVSAVAMPALSVDWVAAALLMTAILRA